MITTAPKRKQEGVLQEKVPPKARGFSTLSVTEKEGHRTRTRLEEFCAVHGHVNTKGKPDVDSAINALLDHHAKPVPQVEPVSTESGVPVETLEPVSKALHSLDRQIAHDEIRTKEGLLRAVRAIRDLLDELLSR